MAEGNHRTSPKLKHNQRRKLINNLMSSNCDPDQADATLAKISEFSPEFLKNYIDRSAEQHADEAVAESSSEELKNLHEWCKYLTTAGAKQTCNHEIPVLLQKLADHEDTDNAFRPLYGMLANLMMGYPVKQLDGDSSKILKEAYDELILDIQADSDQVEAFANTIGTSEIVTNPEVVRQSVTSDVATKSVPVLNSLAAVLSQRSLNLFELPLEMIMDD